VKRREGGCWLAKDAGPGQLEGVRLFQDQIYQKGDRFIRILRLDRYEVEYKAVKDSPKGVGEVAVATKKEFCRLIKGMALVVPKKEV
jgi:hypothetical protein